MLKTILNYLYIGSEVCISYQLSYKPIGPKKIDTKPKIIKNGLVTFNEKFEMKTQIEYDQEQHRYSSKPVLFYLY